MTLQLDHLFVITQPGAPVSELMIEQGFIEGSANTHPGQGTANRRFFFNGFTLEWLFISDEQEAKNGPGQDLLFTDRSTQAKASPFGIVVRSDREVSYPHWLYWPDYFHGKMSFAVGSNSSMTSEPLCICMPIDLPKKPASALPDANPQLLTHAKIQIDTNQLSAVAKHFNQIPGLDLVCGDFHSLVLTLDDGRQGKVLNLAPEAPLQIIY